MGKRIAIFASGSGSNAQNISKYFQKGGKFEIALILVNNPEAGVIQRAYKLNIPVLVFSKKNYQDPDYLVNILKHHKVDLVVLAGFLWLIPLFLIQHFEIVNIHPALLPAYGGKGMWGKRVHELIVQNGERQSGITIHRVDEKYDEGQILFQATCEVSSEDTPESLARKIQELEYKHFPIVIESLLDETYKK